MVKGPKYPQPHSVRLPVYNTLIPEHEIEKEHRRLKMSRDLSVIILECIDNNGHYQFEVFDEHYCPFKSSDRCPYSNNRRVFTRVTYSYNMIFYNECTFKVGEKE